MINGEIFTNYLGLSQEEVLTVSYFDYQMKLHQHCQRDPRLKRYLKTFTDHEEFRDF